MAWVKDSLRYNDEKLQYLKLENVERVEIADQCPMLFQIGLFFEGDQRMRIYSGDRARSILKELGLSKMASEEIVKRRGA